MKDYLKAIILEQLNRALCMKSLIHPIRHQELAGLAERCTNIVDNITFRLKFLLDELKTRNEDDIRDILRELRRRVRDIEMIESHGISVLYYVSDEIKYMNKLIFQIHKEINLPLPQPSVACICAPQISYYSFQPFTNVIFMPVGESHFLLHLPDAFHEIGHYVLFNRENTERLTDLNNSYNLAITKITDYYREILAKKIRETGPEEISRAIMHIHYLWKEYWINEFFCDLFALYTLGPAYAWSHLHLTIKKSDDIYRFSNVFRQTHPSDDSRMKMLLIGLNILGYNEESTLILSKWKDMPCVTDTEPVVDYQYAYPKKLMNEIAKLIFNALKNGYFSILTPNVLGKQNSNHITKILNDAWTLFWNNPEKFRTWEEKCIDKLKAIVS